MTEEKKVDSRVKKKGHYTKRVLLWIFLLILLLILSLAAILYIPAVQNSAIDYITKRMSKDINGDINVGEVSLDIFKGLVIRDVKLIEKESRDTLFSIDQLNTGFKDNLSSLFKRRLSLSVIEVEGVDIVDVTGSQDAMSRLTAMFLRESEKTEQDTTSGQRSTDSKPFYLQLEKVLLHDISYEKIDSVKGQRLAILLRDGKVIIDSINFDTKDFFIKELDVQGADFEIDYFLASDYSIPEESLLISDGETEEEIAVPDTFNFYVEDLGIDNGVFLFNDLLKTESVQDGFDPARIDFRDISMRAKDFYMNSHSEINAVIEQVALRSSDDEFVVEDFSCGVFSLSKRRMTFDELSLKSEHSNIKDKLIFKFRDIKHFNDFNNKVILEAHLSRSDIGINDLIYFAPSLSTNKYFADHRNLKIRADGILSGRVNSLNTNEVTLRLSDEILIEGRMNSRNLADVNNTLLNLDLSKLNVSVSTLSELIPGFNPPPNFYKLGRISFEGRFDGYFQDFVAYGDLNSDLGSANLDMRLDLKDGVERAKYSGKATLNNFDLATWSGNSDFGILAVSAQVEDGEGLRIESVNTVVNANVDRLEYKGYAYEDFKMDGKFEKQLFDGDFLISDENIDLSFQGTVDFTDSIPKYDFTADVNALKLRELNIIEEDFALSGFLDIQANGTDINNAQGLASGSSFILYKDDKEFKLDSFDLRAEGAYPNRRNFLLTSSLANVELTGLFKMEELPDAFISSLKSNYPSYTKNLKSFQYPEPTPGYDFNVNISITESEDIFEVLLDQSIFIRDARLLGRISDVEKRSALEVDFPYLEVNGDVFEDIKGQLNALADDGELSLSVRHMNISDIDFLPIELSATAEKENLYFTLYTDEVLDSFQNIKVEGNLLSKGDRLKLSLNDAGFDAFGSNWRFNQRNNIVLGDRFVSIDNLMLSDGSRTLEFDDINEKGVEVTIQELNTSFFEKLIPADQIELRGALSGKVEVEDIFEFSGVNANLTIPQFGFNDHSFGKVVFQAISTSFEEPIAYELSTVLGDQNIDVQGAYDVKGRKNTGRARVNSYPLDLLEYIIPEGISQTKGEVSGALSYKGLWDYPEVLGNLMVNNGGTKIDYLGTYYEFGKNNIKFTEGYLDFTGSELIDTEGQIANVEGGLLHSSFRNFAADLNIKSPRFIALNTTKKDNPSYHGFAQGEMDIDFKGPFENIEITVFATTGRSTILNIPVEYTTENRSSSFIPIIDRSAQEDTIEFSPVEISGLSLDMNVTVTEDAEVVIIFDETANDIMKSQGRGDIQLSIDPEGNFEMLGNYEVESGQYLFTIPSLFINKSFNIKKGGRIQWTGDPLDANLDLEAEYRNLRTSLEQFLAEYLPEGNERLLNEARLNTVVALAMDLGGTISSPDIDFKISFPDLTGEIKSIADGKLSELESNTDAYNEQVFALMMFRTFLNSGQALATNLLDDSGITNTIYSTISEFMSSQFSLLLTSLFDEAVGNNTYFTGIDVNFGASKNSGFGVVDLTDGGILPDAYDINLKSSFDDNKWNIQVGGKYIVNSLSNENGQGFGTDFVFEYYLTEDRRLKLNVYARYNSQDAVTQQRVRSGVGVSYRKEFNTLSDFFNKIKEDTSQTIN